MTEDPIVEEVRRIRHEIAEKCGQDIEKIAWYAKEKAREFLAARSVPARQPA